MFIRCARFWRFAFKTTIPPGLPNTVPTVFVTVRKGTVAEWDGMLNDLESICTGHKVNLAVELDIADEDRSGFDWYGQLDGSEVCDLLYKLV